MKNRILRQVSIILAALMICMSFAACGGNDTEKDGDAGQKKAAINVISREEGSGTRGAFVELFGIEEKDADGNKVDKTIATAAISNSTGVVLTNVSSDKNAIGYVSLGSLNDTVKALKIDGAEASVENIKNGEYKVSRPFNIVTKADVSDAAQDFINFILSAEGQKVVEAKAYIPNDGAEAFESTNPSGKVVVAGSSSVTPLMEKLKEAYEKINPNVTIELQQSDSSSGVQSTISGICDIGMASRELKDSETAEGVSSTVIATDGIAVVVNRENTVDNLTADQVKGIYTGKITDWSEIA